MLKLFGNHSHYGWRNAIIPGILIALLGLAGLMIPPVARLEPDVGLKWLFNLRGPRPAPEEVVVVTIDKDSSRQLQLPNVPRKWPRRLHAELVRKLHAADASVVSFDMIFTDHRNPGEDRDFALAMQEAGNVILFEYLQSEVLGLQGPNADTAIHVEQRVPPIPEFTSAALAVAPFNLPKVPERVNQAWLFKSGAGDLPSLPVVALHHHLRKHFPELRKKIIAISGSSTLPAWLQQNQPPESPAEMATRLHQFFRQHPDISKKLQATVTEPALRALLLTHTAGNGEGVYLDFYGPARSVTTIPYYQVLQDPDPADFKDKAVFVGFSERLQPEQKDGFYTAFTDEKGLDVSGVEIMATTFANLLESRIIHPLPPPCNIILVIVFGLFAGMLLYRLQGARAVAAAIAIAIIYLGGSYLLFANRSIWTPLVIPLLMQLPFALVLALLLHYLISHRERSHLHHAFKQYVPEHVATAAAKHGFESLKNIQTRFGACLATDAADYTPLSEKLSPTELHNHLNDYFQQLFIPVHKRNGMVVDVVGDAMLSAWVDGEEKALRKAACEAAIEIQKCLNQQADSFPTRIGLHCGEISIGNVGAGEHFEYRIVGDVVNTSTRIEGMNKQLGTQILASAEMLADIDDLPARNVGRFRLKGKQQPLTLYELGTRPASQELLELFHQGLQHFQQQEWKKAEKIFNQILRHHPSDGPTLFYLRLLQSHQQTTPEKDWDGVVNISQK